LDLYIPVLPNGEYTGDTLVVYFSRDPTLNQVFPYTETFHHGQVLADSLKSAVAIVRSRVGLLGYFNFKQKLDGNFGLKDQSLALSFLSENFEILFSKKPRINLIGDGIGAEQAAYQLQNWENEKLENLEKFVLLNRAPVMTREPFNDFDILKQMCSISNQTDLVCEGDDVIEMIDQIRNIDYRYEFIDDTYSRTVLRNLVR